MLTFIIHFNFINQIFNGTSKHVTYVLYSLKVQEFYTGSSFDFDRRTLKQEQSLSKSTATRRPLVPLLCEYYF